ncbi:MAG: quinohemoprotein amine dehydrogenase subunit alpha, partial [Blastocatellia bacterium]
MFNHRHRPRPAQGPEKPKEPPKESDEPGFAVTSPLVVAKCAGCHKQDDKGRMTRISWERTTPEGWQQVIKRMVRLNGLTLSPDEARQIVRYLSNNHGLAPEEARPALYQAEHRTLDETVPDESVRGACVICHTYGRIISQRRSREEWNLLINMHAGYFPVVEFQGFRRFPAPPDAPPPPPGTDMRHPADRAVEFLAKTFPVHTPEWAAWSANLRTPRIAGRWIISGNQTGKGRVYGETIITTGGAEDEFTTQTTLTFVKSGKTIKRAGRGIVYTGHSWRGRSTGAAPAADNGADVSDNPRELREVMLVSRDWAQMDGRWFWGEYEEFGIDVTLRRVGGEPLALGLDRFSLRAPSTGEQVDIIGASLPADLKPEDIDFGPGVKVTRVVSATPDAVTVTVDVEEKAAHGKRDVSVRRSLAPGAMTIYDKADYIKVNPDNGMARLGGVKYPKGYQQFEAIAWHRGPDNKPQTPDDLSLGPVDVTWSVDEFPAIYDDDDKNY